MYLLWSEVLRSLEQKNQHLYFFGGDISRTFQRHFLSTSVSGATMNHLCSVQSHQMKEEINNVKGNKEK
jgi:hypothetical protein